MEKKIKLCCSINQIMDVKKTKENIDKAKEWLHWSAKNSSSYSLLGLNFTLYFQKLKTKKTLVLVIKMWNWSNLIWWGKKYFNKLDFATK